MSTEESADEHVLHYSKEASLSILDDLFLHIQNGIMITDEQLRILDVNPAFTTITEYTKEEVIGKTPKVLTADNQEFLFSENVWQKIEDNGYWQGELTNRKKSGAVYPELLTIHKIYVKSEDRHYYVGVFSDITSIHKNTQEKIKASFYDPLTKVANRELLFEHLDRDIAQLERFIHDNNELRFIGVIFIDLNKFKPINDTYGHLVGDMYLLTVAEKLKQCSRKTDTVARYGGDEFVILCPMIKERNNMKIICNRIIASFETPTEIEGHNFILSASFGISTYPYDAQTPEDLIRCADSAMYAVKKSKKDNAYCFHDEMMG